MYQMSLARISPSNALLVNCVIICDDVSGYPERFAQFLQLDGGCLTGICTNGITSGRLENDSTVVK